MQKYLILIVLLTSCSKTKMDTEPLFTNNEWEIYQSGNDILFIDSKQLRFNNDSKKCTLNGIIEYPYIASDTLLLIYAFKTQLLYQVQHCDSLLILTQLYAPNIAPIILINKSKG